MEKCPMAPMCNCDGSCRQEKVQQADHLSAYIDKPEQGNSAPVILFILVAWISIIAGIILIVRTLSGTL